MARDDKTFFMLIEIAKINEFLGLNEPRHEKTGFLQMRKQRHRSASR